MTIAAAIPIALQIFQAIKQGSQANKMAGQYERPNMEIPQGMWDALDIKKNLALQTGLPRQDLIEQKLDESAANTMANIKEGATSPWDVIKGAQRVGETRSEKIKDLGIAGGEYQANAANDLARAFEGLAKLQQDQFMFNDYQPYMNAMNTVRGLREASTRNLYSGASNAAALSLYSNKEDGDKKNIWESIFGDRNKNATDSYTGGLKDAFSTMFPSDTERMQNILSGQDAQLYNYTGPK